MKGAGVGIPLAVVLMALLGFMGLPDFVYAGGPGHDHVVVMELNLNPDNFQLATDSEVVNKVDVHHLDVDGPLKALALAGGNIFVGGTDACDGCPTTQIGTDLSVYNRLNVHNLSAEELTATGVGGINIIIKSK